MIGLVQKATALCLGIVSSASLLIMYRYSSSKIIFFVVLGILICLLVAASYSFRRIAEVRGQVLPLLLMTVISCVGLATVMEWPLWRNFLSAFIGVAVTLLFGWSAIDMKAAGHKPFRRMKMMLWVFDVYAMVTTFFALGVFFPEVPVWVFHLTTGIVLSAVSYMIWRMYYEAGIRELALWLLIVAIIMIECTWAMDLLPFGYLVSGLLVTWVWYILQLLLRFHIGPLDVVWRKQRWFLATNAVLFAATMYLARWV